MVVMGKRTADRRGKEALPERADDPRYRPIANGTTSREPHLEHFHRRASSTTVVQGLCWTTSSSIGHRCLWPQPLQWAPRVATLRGCWSAARDTSQVSRDFSSMARW